jgi:hypothetical protein
MPDCDTRSVREAKLAILRESSLGVGGELRRRRRLAAPSLAVPDRSDFRSEKVMTTPLTLSLVSSIGTM